MLNFKNLRARSIFMYFEIEPKGKTEDFFNYKYEYSQLKKAIEKREKITAVIGVRRVGKTSLLNIAFNETRHMKLWLDGRIVTQPKKEVFAAIFDTVKNGKPKIFGKIESLNLTAFGVGLGIKLTSDGQAQIENKIRNAGDVTVFIDEAQRMDADDLADVLSYAYDRFPKLCFVISGSEIGLLEEILGENDADHPLYGREITRITINRLERNASTDYLIQGFAQLKMKLGEKEIGEAVEELDGLIGWLTLFGYERGIKKSKDALERTSKNAARIAATELTHFLRKSKNKKLYLSILRNANGTPWEELRTVVSKDIGKRLNPNSFNSAIGRLSVHSFIEKKDQKFHRSDPLLLKAAFLV